MGCYDPCLEHVSTADMEVHLSVNTVYGWFCMTQCLALHYQPLLGKMSMLRGFMARILSAGIPVCVVLLLRICQATQYPPERPGRSAAAATHQQLWQGLEQPILYGWGMAWSLSTPACAAVWLEP